MEILKNQQNQLPISLGAKMYYPYFKPETGEKVVIYARVNVFLGKSEGLAGGPIDIAYVLDTSGSTSRSIDDLRKAVATSTKSLPGGSHIAGIRFSDDGEEETFCQLGELSERKGKFIQAVDDLKSSGGTVMSKGMELGLQELQKGSNAMQVVVLFTDGATEKRDEARCLQLAQQAKDQNIIIIAVGLCVQTGRTLSEADFNPDLLKQIAGAANYEYLEEPQKIKKVFEKKVLGAAQTAITNAKLVVKPVKWVQVEEGSLAIPTCVASENPLEIPVGQVEVEKEVAALLKIGATLPDDVIADEEMSFVRIGLVGDVPSLGIVQEELAKTNAELRFSNDEQLTNTKDAAVDELIDKVAIAQDLEAAAVAKSAEEASEKLEAAREKTQALNNDELAAALLEQIDSIEETIEEGDLQRAQQQADDTSRKTAVFNADDIAESLKQALGGDN